jgi:hypothetical protein
VFVAGSEEIPMRTVAILRRAIACLLLTLATTVASAQTELPEDPREVLKA